MRPDDLAQEVLALFDHCAPMLLRHVRSFGLSADETEDIVQEVFLLLFRHLGAGGGRGNLQGWLFQVARNLSLKQRRRLARRARHETANEELAAGRIDEAPDPEARLALSQRLRLLQSVLRALPRRDRQCLSLRADGLRYREIAKALGMSLGSVTKSLTRSMSRLLAADER